MSWTSERIKQAEALVRWTTNSAVALALATVAVLATLAELHIVDLHAHPFLLLTIVGATIFFFRHDVLASHRQLAGDVAAETGAMRDLTARIETTQGQIENSVGALSADVGLMRETLHSRGKLRSLEQAMADLAPRFAAVRPGEEVVIDHLGLNMSAAWDRLCPLLEHLVHEKQAHVRFRLLILCEGGSGAVEGAGRTVALPEVVTDDWLPGVAARRRKIEREIGEIQANDANGGTFDGQVRPYRDVPAVYGIFIRIGEFEAAYVAICRWNLRKAKEFKWGEDEYHRVLGPASQEQRDLMVILRGYFERWWLMNKPPAPAPAPARPTRAPKKKKGKAGRSR